HFFDVALGTGLRLGELRALRWRDVDRERRVIRVECACSRREIKRPKSDAGRRAVPLFRSVDDALRSVAARAVERGRYAPDELVFGTIAGRRCTSRTSAVARGDARSSRQDSRTSAIPSMICGIRACRAWSRLAPT